MEEEERIGDAAGLIFNLKQKNIFIQRKKVGKKKQALKLILYHQQCIKNRKQALLYLGFFQWKVK